MRKLNSKKNKKIRNLIFTCTLIAILLATSTYAWFIGMKTVSVSEFQVDIATTEGLFLSMDGKTWSYNLDAKNAQPYVGHANQWLDANDPKNPKSKGLIPVSTVGDMDSTTSRMKLYEKGSMTATDGGYRLLSTQVKNYTTKNKASNEFIEGDGYVAFDLFIKNLSGTEYYAENNPANEEAIYLNYDSSVTIGSGGVANSGIENSVRVAFAQIGRVIGTTEDVGKITGITCANKPDEVKGKEGVTGICRDAQIWEPNDKKHVKNAINWYNKSCTKRTGDAGSFSYETAEMPNCGKVEDGTAYPTYAISRQLTIDDHVDIYDGEKFNTFTTNSTTYETHKAGKGKYKLVDYPYFTDTTKELKGVKRVPFMTLAPNSITKVRVYIYLEGQDIDNYDYAQLGKQIKVNFGFTKERYEGNKNKPDYTDSSWDDDIEITGPELETGSDAAPAPTKSPTPPVPEVTNGLPELDPTATPSVSPAA